MCVLSLPPVFVLMTHSKSNRSGWLFVGTQEKLISVAVVLCGADFYCGHVEVGCVSLACVQS